VLHAFQKKSKKGAKTPQAELDLVKKRLKDAAEIDAELGPVTANSGGTK
jgi:phage-related protein